MNRIWFPFVALWAAASCTLSGPVAPGPDPDPPDTSATLAARLNEATCRFRIRCALFTGPIEQCLRELSRTPTTFQLPDALADSIAAGLVEARDELVDECVRSVDELSCFPPTEDPMLTVECERAFIGRVEPGFRCISDFACLPGSACVLRASLSCQGTCTPLVAGECIRPSDCPGGTLCQGRRCVARTPGRLGDPCGSGSGCESGLFCIAVTPTDLRCEALPGLLSNCSPAAPGPRCAGGLACVSDVTFGNSTCQPVRGLGEPCHLPFECGDQLVCDPRRSACVERPAVGPCIIVAGVGVCDPFESFCDVTGLVPACTPLRAENQPCVADSECQFGSSCIVTTSGVGFCRIGERERCLP